MPYQVSECELALFVSPIKLFWRNLFDGPHGSLTNLFVVVKKGADSSYFHVLPDACPGDVPRAKAVPTGRSQIDLGHTITPAFLPEVGTTDHLCQLCVRGRCDLVLSLRWHSLRQLSLTRPETAGHPPLVPEGCWSSCRPESLSCFLLFVWMRTHPAGRQSLDIHILAGDPSLSPDR